MWRGRGGFHVLRMILRHGMLIGRVAGGALFRPDPTLTGGAALQLSFDFTRAAFFQRIGASP